MQNNGILYVFSVFPQERINDCAVLFKVPDAISVIFKCSVHGKTHLLDHNRMVHIDQNAVFCNVNQIRMEGGINLKFIEIRTILRLFKLLLEFQQFVLEYIVRYFRQTVGSISLRV